MEDDVRLALSDGFVDAIPMAHVAREQGAALDEVRRVARPANIPDAAEYLDAGAGEAVVGEVAAGEAADAGDQDPQGAAVVPVDEPRRRRPRPGLSPATRPHGAANRPCRSLPREPRCRSGQNGRTPRSFHRWAGADAAPG